jgi:hypothetical protein
LKFHSSKVSTLTAKDSAPEWRAAVAEARARREGETSVYLLGIPLLGDYLEDGLAEFGLSCDDFNDREMG